MLSKVSDLFINFPMDIEDEPVKGYTYIYVYCLDNTIIYTGQTKRSINERHNEHQGDSSGAKYSNAILYIQIKSQYADFAEGYIGRRLQGLCQGELPNIKNCTNPGDDIKKEVQRIAAMLSRFRWHGDINEAKTPIFTHPLETYARGRMLRNIKGICEEESNILFNHFADCVRRKGFRGVQIHDITFLGKIQCLIGIDEKDIRPIMFAEINTASQLRLIKDIRANFPIYGIISSEMLTKNKKVVDNILVSSQIGFLIKINDEVILYKNCNQHVNNKKLDVNVKVIAAFLKCLQPEYYAKLIYETRFRLG